MIHRGTRQDSISIIIPALNEAANLEATVRNASAAAQEEFASYEILIVDDGSSDATEAIADRLSSSDERIRVVHHETTRGLGAAFKTGLRMAGMTYVTQVNGQNDITADGLANIWRLRGRADIVIPYIANNRERPWLRRMVSGAFTALVNLAFGLRVAYYNHYVLHRRDLVRAVALRTNGYGFQAELMVKLIKSGHSTVEVGHHDTFDDRGPTRLFRPTSMGQVVMCLAGLVYDVYVRRACRKA